MLDASPEMKLNYNHGQYHILLVMDCWSQRSLGLVTCSAEGQPAARQGGFLGSSADVQ